MHLQAAALCVLLAFLAPAGAAPGSQERLRTYQYVLADAESRLDARRTAVRELQHQAAQEAGAFIHARQVQRDGHLADTITAVTSATVELEVLSESLSIRDGRAVLTIEARTRVDLAAVERSLDALGRDAALQQRLRELTTEAVRLEARLARERAGDRHRSSPAQPPLSHDATIARLERNALQARALIVSLSPDMVAADRQHADARAVALDTQLELEQRVFEALIDLPIHARLERARPRLQGPGWQADLVVTWDAHRDAPGAPEALCEILLCDTQRWGITDFVDPGLGPLQRPLASPSELAGPWRQAVATYLLDAGLQVEVTLGHQSWSLPLYSPPAGPEAFERLQGALLAVDSWDPSQGPYRTPDMRNIIRPPVARLGRVVWRHEARLPIQLEGPDSPPVHLQVVRLSRP